MMPTEDAYTNVSFNMTQIDTDNPLTMTSHPMEATMPVQHDDEFGNFVAAALSNELGRTANPTPTTRRPQRPSISIRLPH